MTAEPATTIRPATAAARIEQALRTLDDGGIDAARQLLEAMPPSDRDDARCAALGMVHLAAGRHALARSSLRVAVALGDTRPVTLLNLAVAEDRAGDTARGRALMRELQRQCPQWDEPLLREAESLRRAGEGAAAEQAYERTLDNNPKRPEALISLAALLLGRGAAARAQMLMLRCCGIAPDRVEAWDTLGISLLQTRDFAAAEAVFAEAQRRDPANAAIALRKVEASVAAGNGERELTRLEVGSLADPLDCVLLTARGVLLNQLGRPDEAVDILEVAASLAPALPAPAAALAMALIRCNRIGQAIPALERALALAPDDVNLRNNHAAALVRIHRQHEAREALEKLVAEHGEMPGFLCNLTNALVSLGLQEDGVRTARRAIELDAGSNLAWRTLCNALPYRDGIGGAEVLDAYRHAGATIARGAAPQFANAPDPQRRIRIGLLSPTLKTHPVGWLTVAGFEALDPARFELICLGQPLSDDALQRRFRAVSSHWHVVDRYAGRIAVERVRDLGIDVLIDLSGYGDQGFMTLCAERLAPVQVKWVGSQNHSTGLAEMDFFITDRWETPPGFERFYSERLLVMPDGYVCYSPPAYAPEVVPSPAARNGLSTFGCFNNLAKVTPRVIATWSAILHRVPRSRLVLKCLQFNERPTRERVHAAFAGHGLAADRIELRGSSPHRDLLVQYGDIDIVLDPFPYSGGLTTCEALWMGVPTVALPGETFASRHSTSHLCNVGLDDWVAADLDAYREIAVRHANDPAGLARLRAALRGRVAASPLCDAQRFGRSLGLALRGAWADWCAAGNDVMSHPTVDINLFVHNGAATLAETIESILAQTWPALTLTIIDNGSTDATGEIARRYADQVDWIRVRRNHANTGAVANCQRAFWHGDADFVMPKTADDLLAPEFVASLMAVLLDHPDCAMCHAAGLVFTGNGVVRELYPDAHRLSAVGPDPVERARQVMSHYTSAPSFWGIYRRSAVDRLLQIPYRAGWDHAVLAELSLYGEIRHVPDFFYLRRDGGGAVARLARECTAYAQRGLPVDDPLADPGWRTPLITTAFNHVEVFSLARIAPERRAVLMALAVQVFRARWLPLLRREAAAFRAQLPALLAALAEQDGVVAGWTARQLGAALIAIETILPEEDFTLAQLEIATLAGDRLRPRPARSQAHGS